MVDKPSREEMGCTYVSLLFQIVLNMVVLRVLLTEEYYDGKVTLRTSTN